MKTFFFISIIFFSCTPNTGQTDSSPASTPTIEERVVKLEIKVANLIIDSVYQAKQISEHSKQIAALKKNDSIYNTLVVSGSIKFSALVAKIKADSIKAANITSLVVPTVQKVISLTSRHYDDSIQVWSTLKPLTLLPAKVASLKLDSAKQWIDINKLKSASPVTQIPIMQSQIKTIQAKDVSQDKILVANSASINNLEDTLSAYKKVGSPDFGLDGFGRIQISPAGMVRIKENVVPQP